MAWVWRESLVFEAYSYFRVRRNHKELEKFGFCEGYHIARLSLRILLYNLHILHAHNLYDNIPSEV